MLAYCAVIVWSEPIVQFKFALQRKVEFSSSTGVGMHEAWFDHIKLRVYKKKKPLSTYF